MHCFFLHSRPHEHFQVRFLGKLKTLLPCSSIGQKWFWTFQIKWVEYQSFWTFPIFFWSGSNHFGQFQIIKISKKNLIWTWPKWFETDKNDLKPTKTNCTCPKKFGRSKSTLDIIRHIEGQGKIVHPMDNTVLSVRQNYIFTQEKKIMKTLY